MKILRLGTGIRKLINTIYVLYNDQSGLNLSNDFVGQAKRLITLYFTHLAFIKILFAYLHTKILGASFCDPGFFEV